MPEATLKPKQRLDRDDADATLTLQDEIDQLRSQLLHSDRLASMGVIAAGIAHEINNLLTPVLVYAQLAKKNPQDAVLANKAIEKTIRGVESATQITQAMLGFAGNSQQDSCANVLQVIQSTLTCMARDPAKDRIRLNVDVNPDINVQIQPLALQQILLNLLLNAYEVLGEQGGTITIAAMQRSNGSTVIRVSDTGPGLPPEIVGRVFEPFVSFRQPSSSSASSRKQGTGLGLSICRQLIQNAGGTITASSGPQSGAVFTMTLTSQAEAHRAEAV